jgi:nicotinamide-nucleotide amidase
MTAAILSTGTELTRGELVNTNSQWLCEQLTLLGFTVVECITVGDDQAHIINALRRLAKQTRVVICTGGLGPTTDDLAREAAAEAIGVDLVRDEASLEAIKARFRTFQRSMPESNAKQALFPRGATIIANAVGTAPGFALTIDTSRCFFLPGVPLEMKHMFEFEVAPQIKKLAKKTTHQVHLQTFGLTESMVADLLADLDVDAYLPDQTSSVTIGYRAHFPVIEVKVLARASDENKAQRLADTVADEIRRRLGSAVFGGKNDTFAEYLSRVLRQNKLTLAVAESCTGGLIGKLITDVPGSSDYLLLDAVTYSNRAKSTLLGVDDRLIAQHGAVSEEVARAMAEGALRVAGSDIAVAVTGIAGPGGGTPEKPVGTICFGLAKKGAATESRSMTMPGNRDLVRTRSAYVAMKMVVNAAQSNTTR